MKHLLSFNENLNWFKINKKTQVQKEINNPVLKDREIKKTIDKYLELKKNVLLYRRLFKANLIEDRHHYYYDKSISFFLDACKYFYRLSKYKVYIEDFDFDDEFEFLSDFLVHRELTDQKSFKDVLQSLMDSVFYLNEIHKNLYNSKYSENDDVFYCVENGNVISFKNRELELKEREKHKDVDPYCEEEWTK